MIKPLPERIKQVMDDMEINQVEMAKLAGVTKGRVNQWLNGTYGSGMSAEAAFRLADKTKFNARWLATGDGPERDPLAANHRVRDLIDNYAKLDERGRQHVLTVAEREASYGAEDSS